MSTTTTVHPHFDYTLGVLHGAYMILGMAMGAASHNSDTMDLKTFAERLSDTIEESVQELMAQAAPGLDELRASARACLGDNPSALTTRELIERLVHAKQ